MPDTSRGLERIYRRSRLRVQSWQPQRIDAGSTVMLAGRALPTQTGATSPGATRILCLAPGDWLIFSDEHTAASLRNRFEPDLAGQGLSLVDVTDALECLEVQGAAARDILSKACGLDVHPRSFRAGQCARTRFAQIPVVIDCLDDVPRFELSVARSYLGYLRSWLAEYV